LEGIVTTGWAPETSRLGTGASLAIGGSVGVA